MPTKARVILCSLFLCLWGNSFSAWASAGQTHRLAIVVGANDGGAGRAILRYAVDDAVTFSSVMTELGGLQAQDLLLLKQPTRASLKEGILSMRQRVAEIHANDGTHRAEVVFYYSGHSDERGLLLGEELFEYRALKQAVDSMGADVRIVVLDSCSSGVLTRLKGGHHQAAFLVDEGSNVEGHAFLTSASADEAAQESDAIQGSFFTHYLVMGLRGAADASADGKVTLSETYQFAFEETLRRTTKTQSGPQHASYDFQLSGTGDLVMTDLREKSAGIVFDEAYGGRIYVHSDKGNVVAEMQKQEGKSMSLRVPPGQYDIYIDRGESLSGAEIWVPEEGIVRLAESALMSVDRLPTVSRGASRSQVRVMKAGDLPAGTRTFTQDELESRRDKSTLMFYGGITSASIGACCLSLGVGGVVTSLIIDEGIESGPISCGSLGCVLVGGLFSVVGASVGTLGKKKLTEDERVMVELTPKQTQVYEAPQAMKY